VEVVARMEVGGGVLNGEDAKIVISLLLGRYGKKLPRIIGPSRVK